MRKDLPLLRIGMQSESSDIYVSIAMAYHSLQMGYAIHGNYGN